jgi:hypothetical protein
MRQGSIWLVGAALVAAVGCGDGGGGPSNDDEGARLASQFERLADSVDGAGYSPTAEALRHAAEIVRLTGHATPVTLTIDGASRSFLAVAEQLDFPDLRCSWPSDSGIAPPPDTVRIDPATGMWMPPDTMVDPPVPVPVPDPIPGPPGECTEVGTFSMRTLIAWEPEHMAEVVRLVADVGSNGVDASVPDVMTGLPTNASPDAPPPPTDPVPGDSAVGGGGGGPDGGGGSDGGGGGGSAGYPGFMGEYLVGEMGTWFAVEGSQTNALETSGGACTSDHASFDWAEFRCESARFQFEFTMRVEPVGIGRPADPVPETGLSRDGAEGEHTLAMAGSAVDGVRLSVVAWAPPPPPVPGPGPGPEPLPPDSTVTNR